MQMPKKKNAKTLVRHLNLKILKEVDQEARIDPRKDWGQGVSLRHWSFLIFLLLRNILYLNFHGLNL